MSGRALRRPSARALCLIAGLMLTATLQAARDWSSLAETLDELRSEGQVPAMGLVILDGGRPVLIRTFGVTTSATPFRWGSITKSFTALAALRLAREHHLALTTPIRPLLGPDLYVNPWAPIEPVRLVHLLELSAGFGDLSRIEFSDNEPRPLWQALARGAGERVTHWPPGLQHSYTNVPPGLTAAVIERVSGSSFEDYLDRTVLEPLGMPNASLDPVPGLPGGFQADGVTKIPYWHMTFKAFGALNASIAEMARFAEALLNHGLLDGKSALPADLIDAFFTPSATLGATAGLEVTYARGSYGWVRGGHVFWGHGGDADGYRSRYGLLREHARGYLIVINTDDPRLLGRLRRTIEDALVADLPTHPSLATNEADLDRYVGSYYPTSARFGFDRWQRGEAAPATIRAATGHLEFQRGESRTRLLPAGDGRFVRPNDPAVTVVFARDAAGYLHLQGELGNFVHLSGGSCPGFIGACE
jgi:CubicO group peptidase (beta-lactamase class C family)